MQRPKSADSNRSHSIESFNSSSARKENLDRLNMSIRSLQRQEEAQRRIKEQLAPRYRLPEDDDALVYVPDQLVDGPGIQELYDSAAEDRPQSPRGF